jgi:hypothetical protein
MAYLVDRRRQLEADLLAELRQAAEEFRRAKGEHQQLLEVSQDLGPSHPDGRTAISKAMRVYNEKLAGYRDAVRAFTNLTVHGKDPGSHC